VNYWDLSKKKIRIENRSGKKNGNSRISLPKFKAALEEILMLSP